MKLLLLAVVLLCTLLPAAALNEEYYSSRYMLLGIDISSNITIIKDSSRSSLNYLTAEISLFPEEGRSQKIENSSASPSPELKDGGLRYRWDGDIDFAEFYYKADIRNEYDLPEIRQKIPFPVKNLDPEFTVYTMPSENIDSDKEEIVRLASEIVEGQDDLYMAVFNIARWVEENINYSLDTLTAEAVQKPSWVLSHRYGVCDEITSLFIALNRAVGIPAKYIAGVAYTNYNDINDWGPHAWAEVYFPGTGWVPFDITYKTYASADATHIKMRESVDSTDVSTTYEWKGRDVDIATMPLGISVKEKGHSGTMENLVSMEIRALKESTGFGSYNVVEVELENQFPYYISTVVSLVSPEQLEVIGKRKRPVALKPGETKSIFWIAKLSNNLKKGYTYSIPIAAFTPRNYSALAILKAAEKEPVYDLGDVSVIIGQIEQETRKTLSKDIILNCSTQKSEYYDYESPEASCLIANTGNVLLEKIDICLEKECRSLDLGIAQEKSISFLLPKEKPGKTEVQVTASSKDISKSAGIIYNLLDRPRISIQNILFPESIRYDRPYRIAFTLDKRSVSSPNAIVIVLKKGPMQKEWHIQKLADNMSITIGLDSRDLSAGKNTFTIDMEYYDNNSREYSEGAFFTITLEDVTVRQRISIFLREIGEWASSLI